MTSSEELWWVSRRSVGSCLSTPPPPPPTCPSTFTGRFMIGRTASTFLLPDSAKRICLPRNEASLLPPSVEVKKMVLNQQDGGVHEGSVGQGAGPGAWTRARCACRGGAGGAALGHGWPVWLLCVANILGYHRRNFMVLLFSSVSSIFSCSSRTGGAPKRRMPVALGFSEDASCR